MGISGYEDWMIERNHSASTRLQRLKFARRLQRDWGTFDVSSRQAIEWLAAFDGWTWHTYLTHMESLYEYLVETDAVAVSPLEHMHRPATPDPAPRPLSPLDRDRVLGSCDGDLRAFVQLAYLAGLRVHEVAKIRGEDVNDSTLRVVGKGRKAAELPIHADIWRLAQSYPREGYWFPSRRGAHLNADTITVRVSAHFRSAGVGTGSMHRLRHTFATDMARNGVHPRVIQVLMRHSSLATTMRYLEAADEEKRRAIGGLSMPPSAIAA